MGGEAQETAEWGTDVKAPSQALPASPTLTAGAGVTGSTPQSHFHLRHVNSLI